MRLGTADIKLAGGGTEWCCGSGLLLWLTSSGAPGPACTAPFSAISCTSTLLRATPATIISYAAGLRIFPWPRGLMPKGPRQSLGGRPRAPGRPDTQAPPGAGPSEPGPDRFTDTPVLLLAAGKPMSRELLPAGAGRRAPALPVPAVAAAARSVLLWDLSVTLTPTGLSLLMLLLECCCCC